MHSIDLSKYNLRTDLALDLLDNKESIKIDNVLVTDILLDDKLSKKINKKKGRYITIEFEDITDFNNKEKVKKVFSSYLSKMLVNKNNYLIVGLGNELVTPDSLGPKSLENIIVTNHIYELNMLEDGFKRVSILKPGVKGQTGIESIDIIKGAIKALKPDQVIIIDSLASLSLNRLNHTIQITDSGISPGSGVLNNRKELSFKTLKVPVLALGVPTVVDAPTIVSDTINYMSQKYLESSNGTKEDLLGYVGKLDDIEIKQFAYEVLNPKGFNLMVTPKEIDYLINNLSDIIGNGINISLHENVNL